MGRRVRQICRLGRVRKKGSDPHGCFTSFIIIYLFIYFAVFSDVNFHIWFLSIFKSNSRLGLKFKICTSKRSNMKTLLYIFYLPSYFYQMLSIMEIHILKVCYVKIILSIYVVKLKVYFELNIYLF